jgi:hypothetical protein
MRFFGIVTLAIALLQREGRITYRALKRGFELDDASLEDLWRERIFRRLARNEAGEGLVWIGGAPLPVGTTADAVMGLSPALALLSPLATDDGSTDILASVRHALEAERRHLTVMFCDREPTP